MKREIVAALAVTAVCALPHVAPAAPAKGKAKPATKTKPAAKAPVKPLGQVPMAGLDNAQIGTMYTLGVRSPINFTLDKAEFSVERVKIGDATYWPKAGEKLLILRYTIHNPQKQLRHYYWGTLRFTAVDAENQNREYTQNIGRQENGERLNIQLKPAQKITAFTYILVPAKGVIPKLIVTPQDGGVLRYDLRGKVAPVPAPWADPADPSGAAALEEAAGEAGKYFALGLFDVKFNSAAFVTEPLLERKPRKGQRFFVVNVTLRNGSAREENYYWSLLKARLTASDGETTDWDGTFLKTERDERASGKLKPGEEYTARLVFQVPENIGVKTLRLSERGLSHAVLFDVSGTQ